MRKSVKYGLIGGGVVLVLVLGWGLYLVALAGEFSSLDYHSDASCRRIEGVVGGEDIVRTHVGVGPEEIAVLISSDDRRATMRGEPVRGGILFLSLDDGAAPYDASEGTPELLHPHGISLVPLADRGAEAGTRERLFVVNHPRMSLFGRNDDSDGPAHTIEIYDVLAEAGRVRLAHRQTIADPMLVSPNDIAAVDDTRFYVTNDHSSVGKLGHKLEDYAHLARGSVLFWDGRAFSRVAAGIHYANGIVLSHDRRSVYVAAVTGAELLVYDRDVETSALTLRERIDTPGPDNISLADDGSLWVGGHPKLLTFTAYSKDPSKRSPSMVSQLVPGPTGSDPAWTQTHPFVSDGTDISGSTTALSISDTRFVIGSVFDAWLLDCQRGV